MATLYIRPGLATGNNNGTTLANAWQTIAAFAAAGCAAGSDVRQCGHEGNAWGDATTRFDITNPSGTTFRYTYDGTGTAPLFVTNEMFVNQSVIINSSTFNAGNNGTFTVTAVEETYFEVTNAAGVAENDKVLSAATSMKNAAVGTSAITFTNNINGSVANGFTTITGYDTTGTTIALRQRNGTGAGASIDGFILNGVIMVRFHYIGATKYTRDGMRAVTTASTSIIFSNCQFDTNSACGLNGYTGVSIAFLAEFCKFNNNTTFGVVGQYTQRIFCCEINNNATGFSTTAPYGIITDSIVRNNATGINGPAGQYGVIKNNVIDGNTTAGITTILTTNVHGIVENRITNNAIGINCGAAVTILMTQYNHFYNNTGGNNVSIANGKWLSLNDDLTETDPYTARASQNFKNINTAVLYKNLVNVGIDSTNVTNIQAGLQRVLDYAVLTKVMADTTNDGDTGTLPLNKVHQDNGGTLDLPIINHVTDDDTLEGVTGGKDHLEIYTETEQQAYADAQEAANNNADGITNADIAIGVNPKILSTQYTGAAVGEQHTDDEVINTASVPGNWNVSNLSNNNILAGLAFGLSQTGLLKYISGVDKARLICDGGEVVTVTGYGFTGMITAKINGSGGTPVVGLVIDSNTQLHFTTPSMVAGTYSLYLAGGLYGALIQDKLFEFDDKLYSAADEITRNEIPDLSLIPTPASGGPAAWLQRNVSRVGTFNMTAWEAARNTALKAFYKLGEIFKLLGVDTTGEYAGGGAVPSPGAPTLGTPVALSTTSIRVYFTWSTDAEKIYLERKVAGGSWGTPVEMAAGAYYYDDTGMSAGLTYQWRARAWNTTGYSSYSTTVEGTTRTTNAVEQTMWSDFKTHMQTDTYLSAYIAKWKFNLEEIIFPENKFPVFKAWIPSTGEGWKGIPKSKQVHVPVIIHCIVTAMPDNIETEKLKADEYIKNALESDMTFDGDTTINIVGDTVFSALDDNKAEIFISCELVSKRFTAGAR